MNFEPDKYEKAVGALRSVQLSLQLFINDVSNDINEREYAETLYEWIGKTERTIDELFEVSYEKSVFILKVLEIYDLDTLDSNIILNYADALESLKFQYELTKNRCDNNMDKK